MESSNRETDFIYAVINNIPSSYHSADLRNYFSQFLETNGFKCFHFKHRPESRTTDNPTSREEQRSGTFCCVVKVNGNRFHEFMKMYNKRHWLDRNGDVLPALCFLSRIKTSEQPNGESNKYKTRAEQKCVSHDREQFTISDLEKMKELHPPDIMPNGNVGTPTAIFLEYIKQCRLPPVIIKNLGLSFPKTRSNKRYGNVPFNYNGTVVGDVGCQHSEGEENPEVKSSKGHEIPTENTQIDEGDQVLGKKDESSDLDSSQNVIKDNTCTSTQKSTRDKFRQDPETKRRYELRIEENLIGKEDRDSDDDNDTCEEWERHEAMYDDPSNQERNSERLFEEEIELKWEKGGSGLVFYTDAQYWKEQEGDFDEQTTDDLDVDMSIYYEEGAGDKDARDYVTMRQETRRRDGVEHTDRFSAGIAKKRPSNMNHSSVTQKIGKFEQHTKGFGRKILTQQGWSEGEGLGSTVIGISEALESEGQGPKDKAGFGYRGEKLLKTRDLKHKKPHVERLITTKYDDPSETDPVEPLLRRSHHYHISHRHSHHVAFTAAQSTE
ncbi:LOW QUALITY PROTEIN: G patch domain-containing protein 3-like [Pecten maximus]|uniref:LOW QUALITY PROTEIN: G patch domain-containing protein 3-like n=1 Tax=Pecten maximus TaxID=6579 RepID=UPI0014580F9D|nr:LOW QUALITY PROTEIN: G patch domain-containing protein 3-like [Pecten maximus]